MWSQHFAIYSAHGSSLRPSSLLKPRRPLQNVVRAEWLNIFSLCFITAQAKTSIAQCAPTTQSGMAYPKGHAREAPQHVWKSHAAGEHNTRARQTPEPMLCKPNAAHARHTNLQESTIWGNAFPPARKQLQNSMAWKSMEMACPKHRMEWPGKARPNSNATHALCRSQHVCP